MRPSSFLTFSLQALLIASCQIYLIRYIDQQPYLRVGIGQSPQICSYSSVTEFMRSKGTVLGPHVAMFYVNAEQTRVFVTDNEAPDTSAVYWKKLESEVLAKAMSWINAEVPQHLKAVTPVPLTDRANMVGLPNIDQKTCYMNSLFQCLYHIPEFTYRIIALLANSHSTIEERLKSPAHMFKNTIVSMNQCAPGGIPDPFWLDSLVRVTGMAIQGETRLYDPVNLELIQNDSAEVMQAVLALLSTELTQRTNPVLTNGPFDDLFQIVIEERVVNHRSGEVTTEAKKDFMLTTGPSEETIEANNEVYVPDGIEVLLGALDDPELYGMTLDEVVEALRSQGYDNIKYSSVSLMDRINFRCERDLTIDNTKEVPEVVKTTETNILRLPPYLFVAFNRSLGARTRAKNPLEFPFDGLDLSPLVKDNHYNDGLPYVYNLKAIVMHIGNHSTSGHYTVLIRSDQNPWSWYLHNDHQVEEFIFFDESGLTQSIKSNASYLLYKRQA